MNGALTSAKIHFVGSQTHIVFFNANGGGCSVNSMEVVNGRPYGTEAFPSAIWEGHTFLGWYTAATGGTQVAEYDIVNLTADQILYAHWEDIPAVFAVTLDACGGAVQPGSVKVTAGGKYDGLPVPVREGYSFEGWFTAANGGKKITSSMTVTLTADQTLYAHWTPNRSSPEIGDLSYSFKNYSTDLPKKYFETFFGATQKATDIYNRYREAGGVCYGFATTTGMFYHANNELSPGLFRSGSANPSQLREEDYNASWGLDVKSFIETMYVSQLTDEIQYVRNTSVNNVSEMCGAVKYFQSTGLNPVYVRITGNGGGHALIGYKLVEISAKESHLMVYDCNYPGNGNLYIRLYKDGSGNYNNEWDYEKYHWGSSYGGDIGYIPYSEYYGVWQKYVMGKSPDEMDNVSLDMNMETLTVNVGDASIYDSRNNLCAVLRDGELRSYRQDIYPLEVSEMVFSDNALPAAEDATYSICLPSDDYTVKNDSASIGSFELDMIDREQSASVTTSAGEITLHVSDRDQINCVQIDQPGKKYSITLYSTLPNASRDIRLSGTTGKEALTILQVSGEVRLAGADTDSSVYIDGELKSALELKGRIPVFNYDFGSDNALADSALPSDVDGSAAAASRFRDVSSDAYYCDSVDWACQKGITTGKSSTEFGPYDNCTRAQAVTFLWRAMGCPESSAQNNPFTDVSESDYYYKAVLWAVEKKIATGTNPVSFGPNEICSRAHIVTFLYRAFGEPEKTGAGNWWEDASAWANANGLFDGTNTAFLSGANCPRGDVVYYLWKAFE